jgi:hypothetical protein
MKTFKEIAAELKEASGTTKFVVNYNEFEGGLVIESKKDKIRITLDVPKDKGFSGVYTGNFSK